MKQNTKPKHLKCILPEISQTPKSHIIVTRSLVFGIVVRGQLLRDDALCMHHQLFSIHFKNVHTH